MIALGALAVVAIGLLVVHISTHDALADFRIYRDSPRAYGGELFRLPLFSLVTTPVREHVHPGIVIYTYCHVLLVLLGCAAQIARWPRSQPLDRLCLAWLLSNTFFQLCIGSTWGFRHFPRFAIPAQPALFWALHPYLPRRRWPWLVSAAGIFYMAIVCVRLAP
jgi:hypothetical protein